jgi:molybdopterin-containing oxidoreductase family iron-sulfur binding subunit
MQSVTLVKADTDDHEFACVQGQNINGWRYHKETSLEIFNTKDAKFWNEVPMVSLNHEVEAT